MSKELPLSGGKPSPDEVRLASVSGNTADAFGLPILVGASGALSERDGSLVCAWFCVGAAGSRARRVAAKGRCCERNAARQVLARVYRRRLLTRRRMRQRTVSTTRSLTGSTSEAQD
jgi:hypothetical protein